MNNSSMTRKIDIILEINLNGFSTLEIQINKIIKVDTIANIWLNTTIDSILLIAKIDVNADQQNKLKNKIEDLLYKYFFNGKSFTKK